MHGPAHHQGVVDNVICVADGGAAGVAKGRHVGQAFTFKAQGQCPQWINSGAIDAPATLAHHVHHGWGIDHRVCVRWHTDTGHAGRNGRVEFAFHGGFVFFARFA